jgi:hypothetical protein
MVHFDTSGNHVSIFVNRSETETGESDSGVDEANRQKVGLQFSK